MRESEQKPCSGRLILWPGNVRGYNRDNVVRAEEVQMTHALKPVVALVLLCGAALAEISAGYSGMDAGDLVPLNIRPPVRNISLSELAELDLLETPST